MLERYEEMGMLNDFYGKLLTEKQQKYLELYYFDNLSLTEIAGVSGISKQAVSDCLKKAEAELRKYEETLGLLAAWKKERGLN